MSGVLLHLLITVNAVADFTTISWSERRRLSLIHALAAPFMPFITIAGEEKCATTVRTYLVYRLQRIDTSTMNFEEFCAEKQPRSAVLNAIKIDGGNNIPLHTSSCYDAYMETFAEQILLRQDELCRLFTVTSSTPRTGIFLAAFAALLAHNV